MKKDIFTFQLLQGKDNVLIEEEIIGKDEMKAKVKEYEGYLKTASDPKTTFGVFTIPSKSDLHIIPKSIMSGCHVILRRKYQD